MIHGFKNIAVGLRRAFSLLKRKDPLILSASTAFFATFSLSPIVLILVYIFGLYFRSERISQQVFRTIGSTLGVETAKTIETIVNNFRSLETNWLATIFGLVFFLFVSTTLLGVVKHAIQRIWFLRTKPQLKLRHFSRERGTQIGLLLFSGFLLLISLLIDTALSMSMDFFQANLPTFALSIIRILNGLFSVVMVTVWFTVLFKYLPEATLSWDTAFNGGLLTGILFSCGKLLLGRILIHSRFETIFGASASFALLLLFIFYSSFILYFGAAFTREFAALNNKNICAGKYSDEFEERIIGQET
ncbi:MAG TPA: YihY/virulence factor BrkB family protein [Chryseosolibacter sp.]